MRTAAGRRVLMITQDTEVDRRILQEARSLSRAGYDVSVLARAGGRADAAGVEDGITVERLAVEGHDRRFGWLYRLVGVGAGSRVAALWGTLTHTHTFSRRAIARAVPTGAEVYHAHDLNTLEVAHRAAAVRGAALVYDAHELFPEIANPWIRLKRRSWTRLERALLPRVDLAITVNELLADEIGRRYGVPPPLVLLNCPERPHGFDPRRCRGLLHVRLGLEPETKIVLYQGWLAPGRGLESLVRAAAYLEDGTAVVLLGYGGYGQKLAALARRVGRGRVHFLPPVPQRDLLAHCAAAEVGVIPYEPVDLNHRLTSPNKLFDFIQAELPIVANDLPYLRTIVQRHGLGVVARLDSPRSYAEAIESVLGRPDGGAELRANLRAVAPLYTWQAEAPKLLAAYSRLPIPGRA